jgi:hypothetical protein
VYGHGVADAVRPRIIRLLLPEPDNTFDRDAVMVEIDGHTAAYPARADARPYQRRLRPLTEPMQIRRS